MGKVNHDFLISFIPSFYSIFYTCMKELNRHKWGTQTSTGNLLNVVTSSICVFFFHHFLSGEFEFFFFLKPPAPGSKHNLPIYRNLNEFLMYFLPSSLSHSGRELQKQQRIYF